MKDNQPEIQEITFFSLVQKLRKITPRHIKAKLLEIKDNEKNLK